MLVSIPRTYNCKPVDKSRLRIMMQWGASRVLGVMKRVEIPLSPGISLIHSLPRYHLEMPVVHFVIQVAVYDNKQTLLSH